LQPKFPLLLLRFHNRVPLARLRVFTEDFMKRFLSAVIATSVVVSFSPAVAHPHKVKTPHHDQLLANGQNHPAFLLDEDGNLMSCEDYPKLAGYGPAWYGLETAHHGPDASGRGKADGCYQIEGNLSPLDPASDRNPAID
jgi:hypothetical protein